MDLENPASRFTTFVRDKDIDQWKWHGGMFVILLGGSILFFTTSVSSNRDLVCG